MVIVLLLAELVPEQPLTDVKVSDTTSPLTSAVVLKVALLVPALLPFIFHWYTGDEPALVTLDVNVACAPAHMLLPPLIVTVAAAGVFTIMLILLDVTRAVATQVALLVITQVTTSLLASEVVV
jgi:hypothetical protein